MPAYTEEPGNSPDSVVAPTVNAVAHSARGFGGPMEGHTFLLVVDAFN